MKTLTPALTKVSVGLVACLMFGSCSSAPKNDADPAEAVNDALLTFTVNAQGAHYSEALEVLDEGEQVKMLEPNGDIREDYKLAMKRLKLSALSRYQFEMNSDGKLVGMLRALIDANTRFVSSDEQRAMNLDKIHKAPKLDAPAPDSAVIDNTSTLKPDPDAAANAADLSAEPAPAAVDSTQPGTPSEP